jgi:hypothetical protein
MTGRDEPMWIVIHRRMEATLRISLYSYLFLKLAKTPWFSYLVFSSTKLENRKVKQVQVTGMREGMNTC